MPSVMAGYLDEPNQTAAAFAVAVSGTATSRRSARMAMLNSSVAPRTKFHVAGIRSRRWRSKISSRRTRAFWLHSLSAALTIGWAKALI